MEVVKGCVVHRMNDRYRACEALKSVLNNRKLGIIRSIYMKE